MQPGLWQGDMLRELGDGLAKNPHIVALFVLGSMAQEAADQWSDLDLLAVVDTTAEMSEIAKPEWFRQFGTVLGWTEWSGADRSLVRACLAPCRRVDIGVSRLPISPPELTTALRPHLLVWAKRPLTRAELSALLPEPAIAAPERYEADVNDIDAFWMKAAVALGKMMREDLLIAEHLALELTRECLVLAMMRRDLETGTIHHQRGGPSNCIVPRLTPDTSQATPFQILDRIELASQHFAGLREALWPGETEAKLRHEMFLLVCQQARIELCRRTQ